jgi:hypothetical protein
MMKSLIYFIGIMLVMSSCVKQEIRPQQPIAPQPIITNPTLVDSTVTIKNTTWVIGKVLNTDLSEEMRSDTLKFITNTTYSFNGIQSTYGIYSTPTGYKLNLNNTPWGHISCNLVEYNLTSGNILNKQFNDIFTSESVIKIWMYKQ